ncbi:unnamed protein product (macronuclear) [Paramecium tetraurelia]|uniref:Uncharacterized protein n=1 Tax=Paramecium tetraurelia TaxID=5888 RepID=A0EII5_PARTE|nr:uncharacterized protein GSPATT00027455001 [Paramecium tetraurelia]CAK95126.1 unnamed protein product [Paramecium tetraurelia]|eukprot:XP_001462499.1 hypothetical protein (macronuclear) [Paramecium tetraurelia strain d4-2]
MSIQYTSDEQLTFQYFFTICDKTDQGILRKDMATNFLQASGLNQQILKTIYEIASSNDKIFTKDEFFAALKLIALAQDGYYPEQKLLTQNIPTLLPQIQGYQHPIYDIPEEQMRKYETYFVKLDKDGNQTIKGKHAKALFSKSGLSQDKLKEIWNLCDIGEKGHLSKGEFIVAFHLVLLCCKCKYPLPTRLPDSLLQLAARISINPRIRLESNQNAVPQQRLGSNSNLLNQPRQRLGSDANNGIQQVQNFDQIQQVIEPLNANILPGYDQNEMNSMRQQINDSTQQVYKMQNQFNEFYQNNTLLNKEEMYQLQAQNDKQMND